jgi:hypothetical protein
MGILVFVQNKKRVGDTCLTSVSRSTAFRRCLRLTLVALIVLLLHHLICIIVLYYIGSTCMAVRSGLVQICFSFFPFLSLFFTSICTLSLEKITSILQFLTPSNLVSFLLSAIFKFEDIISIWKIIFNFFHLSDLVLHSFNCYFVF